MTGFVSSLGGTKVPPFQNNDLCRDFLGWYGTGLWPFAGNGRNTGKSKEAQSSAAIALARQASSMMYLFKLV